MQDAHIKLNSTFENNTMITITAEHIANSHEGFTFAYSKGRLDIIASDGELVAFEDKDGLTIDIYINHSNLDKFLRVFDVKPYTYRVTTPRSCNSKLQPFDGKNYQVVVPNAIEQLRQTDTYLHISTGPASYGDVGAGEYIVRHCSFGYGANSMHTESYDITYIELIEISLLDDEYEYSIDEVISNLKIQDLTGITVLIVGVDNRDITLVNGESKSFINKDKYAEIRREFFVNH